MFILPMAISNLLKLLFLLCQLQCILLVHVYPISISSTSSSFFAFADMSPQEATINGKWRLKMSRLRLRNQYSIEQMVLSIGSGWSKWVVQADLARRQWDTLGPCKKTKKKKHTTTGVHAIPDLTQSTTRSDWPVGRGCLLVSKSCPVHVLHLERKATAVHPCIHYLKSYTPGGCISKCQTVKLK